MHPYRGAVMSASPGVGRAATYPGLPPHMPLNRSAVLKHLGYKARAVIRYIRNQHEHHRTVTWEEVVRM